MKLFSFRPSGVILACLLLGLLAGCKNNSQTMPPIETSFLEATPEPTDVQTSPPHTEEVFTIPSFLLTLTADQTEVLYNGKAVTLSSAPFIQDRAFYYPLQDVVELLGGSLTQTDDCIQVELFEHSLTYRLHQPAVEIDGTVYEMYQTRQSFDESLEKIAVDAAYGPIEVEGKIFIPSDLHSVYCPHIGLDAVGSYPEGKMIMLGFLQGKERGIDQIRLYDDFDALPLQVRELYPEVGVVDQMPNYTIVQYGTCPAQIYVMRLEEGTEDIEHMDGKICTIHAVREGVITPRGLQVGDTALRAWQLYGHDNFASYFHYQIDGGFVSFFTFYTRYYGGNLPKLYC